MSLIIVTRMVVQSPLPIFVHLKYNVNLIKDRVVNIFDPRRIQGSPGLHYRLVGSFSFVFIKSTLRKSFALPSILKMFKQRRHEDLISNTTGRNLPQKVSWSSRWEWFQKKAGCWRLPDMHKSALQCYASAGNVNDV